MCPISTLRSMRAFTTAVLLIALFAVPAGAGVTERVSVSSSGEEGNSSSSWPRISPDGRYVAFNSHASNIVADDTNEAGDVFVHDRLTGRTIRVSVSSTGEEAHGSSGLGGVTVDGRYVTFASTAGNLVPEDTNSASDVFIHNTLTGETARVSVSSTGEQGNDGSHMPSLSRDGQYVVFYSGASNLVAGDTNGTWDVFVHDRLSHKTTRVSLSSTGEQGDDGSMWPEISADGRYVAFDSYAGSLVPGDTNGLRDVFVHDRLTAETSRVSVASTGAQGNDVSTDPCVSAAGRYVTYLSYAGTLVPDDANGYADVFVHDGVTKQTTRISVSSMGVEGNGHSGVNSISADGRYITFDSFATNLAPGDTNGVWDVLLRDTLTGRTSVLSVSSTGEWGNGRSVFPSISGDARYVAFRSHASNLVPGDTNAAADVFVRDTWGLGDIKAQPDGAAAAASAYTVTAAFPGSFYVEDADRSSGIKVAWPDAVATGTRYRVDGVMATDLNGERFINASNVRAIDTLPVEPLGVTCRAVGGAGKEYDPDTGAGQRGIEGASGLNNIGLLIRTCGSVTQIGPDYLYIDDGSKLKDGTTTATDDNVGVRVVCDPTGFARGDFLVVTGISSCFQTPSGQTARRILARSAADIQGIN